VPVFNSCKAAEISLGHNVDWGQGQRQRTEEIVAALRKYESGLLHGYSGDTSMDALESDFDTSGI
jgi:hypothetical protein